MQEIVNYKMMKDFLSFNKLNFSKGFVIEKFYIEYYIGNELRYKGSSKIHFQIQHPEFYDDVEIFDLDSEIFYIGFNAKFQVYEFNASKNIFIIKSKDENNKFKKNYEVNIYGYQYDA